jgi:hypothetical protein
MPSVRLGQLLSKPPQSLMLLQQTLVTQSAVVPNEVRGSQEVLSWLSSSCHASPSLRQEQSARNRKVGNHESLARLKGEVAVVLW